MKTEMKENRFATIKAVVVQEMYSRLTQKGMPDAEVRSALKVKYPSAIDQIDAINMTNTKENTTMSENTTSSVTPKPTAKPKANKTAKPKANKTAKPKANKTAKASKPKVEKVKRVTKVDRAREIFATAPDKSRKAIIEAFTTQLGMSKVAASTYFYNIKNAS